MLFAFSVLLIGRATGKLKAYQIPTVGMAPALCPGDHFMAEGFSLMWRGPRRGEMIAFTTAGSEEMKSFFPPDRPVDIVQRIVGIPGDHLQLKDGVLMVNGGSVPELAGLHHVDVNGFFAHEVVVPAGHYLMLGDNSPNSLDSRYWGFLPAGCIKSRYLCHYWKVADRSGTRDRP